MNDDLRFLKIDDAIQKLATIATDLSKMLAVHEHRILSQEKTADSILQSIEKRREEIDNRFKDFYQNVHVEIHEIRDNNLKQNSVQNEKISKIESIIWMYIGACAILSWAVPFLISKIFR
jgi:hypothetical protein